MGPSFGFTRLGDLIRLDDARQEVVSVVGVIYCWDVTVLGHDRVRQTWVTSIISVVITSTGALTTVHILYGLHISSQKFTTVVSNALLSFKNMLFK